MKPHRSILITNSSLPPMFDPSSTNAAHVFPVNSLVPKIPNTQEGHEAFVEQFLLDSPWSIQVRNEKLENLGPFMRSGNILESENSAPKEFTDIDESLWMGSVDQTPHKRLRVEKIQIPTILICGHNSRDTRCGVLGPLLRTQFKQSIEKAHDKPAKVEAKTRIALTSHIGGHAWAGNVIIYTPPRWRLWGGERSPLAGMGVWYGRVEPRHVDGIVNETFIRGRLIEELLRGTVT